MVKPALLLLNGPLGDRVALKRRAAAAGFIVCADGGAKNAKALGLTPRVVVGDMDSVPHPLPRWKGTVYLFDDDPDTSDFEKALAFLHEGGAGQVWVAGLWGGRPDHQLVNLAVFERWSRRLSMAAIDPGWTMLAGPGRHVIPCPAGAVVSLVPSGASARVTTKNLEFPLSRSLLARGSRGLSNKATASPVEVVVHSGRLWLTLA